MARTRVTVILNRTYPDEPQYMSEWQHEDGYCQDEGGVTITWEGTSESSFFPWTSILRVDREPCDCMECSS